MPIIVSCPTCSGQLRIADDLIGRRVRCPACNSTFEANEAAPVPAAPPPDLPVETETVPAWKHLNLELDSSSQASKEAPDSTGQRNGDSVPKGAVEIEVDPEQPPPRSPSAPEQEDWPERVKRQKRPSDDEDDVRPCPVCGKPISRDANRCSSCRARLDPRRRSRRYEDDEEDDDYPRRRRARRDCEPHRGGLILTFGIISTAAITLALCYGISALPGIGFGIAAWIMGSGDLRKIRDGAMDPDGEGTTKAGWICGIIGTFVNLIVLLACGTIAGYLIYSEMERTKQIRNQRNNAPPPFKPKKGS